LALGVEGFNWGLIVPLFVYGPEDVFVCLVRIINSYN